MDTRQIASGAAAFCVTAIAFIVKTLALISFKVIVHVFFFIMGLIDAAIEFIFGVEGFTSRERWYMMYKAIVARLEAV